jgi:hypothetical protein
MTFNSVRQLLKWLCSHLVLVGEGMMEGGRREEEGRGEEKG